MEILISESSAMRHYTSAKDAYKEAAALCPAGRKELFFIFGGRTVRMRIIGRRLENLMTRPFSHLRLDELPINSPDLRIDLWDRNEIKIKQHQGERIYTPETPELTEISATRRLLRHITPNTKVLLDRKSAHITGSIAWNDKLLIYEQGKPLSRLLVEWYNDHKVQVIHAGLVSRNNKGILIGGPAGSGKSTTALACLQAGFDFLSEDYVGLERGRDGLFLGHSLYSSIFVDPGVLSRFPELKHHMVQEKISDNKKSLVLLSESFPKQIKSVSKIKAVILCRHKSSRNPGHQTATKAEALLTLGPTSIFEIPGRGKKSFEVLVQLIEGVPCFWLETKNNLDVVVRNIEELLTIID